MVLNAGVLVGTIAFLFKFVMVTILNKGDLMTEWALAIAPHIHIAAEQVTRTSGPWILCGLVTAAGTLLAAIILIPAGVSVHNKSVWSHPHFAAATLAQFLYVAAQAGIFSFFINYIVAELPAVGENAGKSWFSFVFGGEGGLQVRDGSYFVNELGATKLLSVGFSSSCAGGSRDQRSCAELRHLTLGIYAAVNTVLMVVIYMKLGWISLISLFLSFFVMSIMFPTIFALGIYGLGSKTKMASSFIVMSITGGAMMPQVMGLVGDRKDMSGFLRCPWSASPGLTLCLLLAAAERRQSLTGVSASKGH